MKSVLIYFVALVFIVLGFGISITHILGWHQKFYSLLFFIIGGSLYQFAGFLHDKEKQ